MATNRFYTPALPQYTSQFVEDRTPWQQMLALNQQKIGRADAALAGAAQAESQFSSLMPGYRTADIVPGVISDYDKELAQWQEKHGQHLYSVPAMRDLTKIQGRFQSDPRVKLVQQDVQETPMIQRYISDPNYRPETDPNIDPQTGQFRQFTPDESFTPFQAPVYIGNLAKEMGERYANIDPDLFQSEPKFETIEDPETGEQVKVLRQDTYSGISGESEKIKTRREAYAQELAEGQTDMGRYYKQLYGDEWDINKARDLVRQHESQYYQTKQLIDTKFIPRTGTGTDKDKDPFPGVTIPQGGTHARHMSNQVQVGGGEGDPGKILTRQEKSREKIRAEFFDQDYFNAAKGNKTYVDPSDIVGLPTIGGVGHKFGEDTKLTVDKDRQRETVKHMFFGSLDEDYDRTMNRWEYYSKLHGDLNKDQKWMANTLNRNLSRWKDEYDNINKKRLETLGTMFNNEASQVAAYNTILDNDLQNHPNFPFESVEEFQNSDPTKWSIKQKSAVSKLMADQMGKDLESAQAGVLDHITDDQKSAITKTLFGIETTKGEITIGKEGSQVIPSAVWLNSARIIPLDDKNPDKDLDSKERSKLLESGNVLSVDGMIRPETSQYGPGLFQISIDGKRYAVSLFDEYVNYQKFESAAYSHELPQAQGVGEPFTVSNAFPGSTEYGPFIGEMSDVWDKKSGRYDPSGVDITFQLRNNAKSGFTELLIYNKDPNQFEDAVHGTPIPLKTTNEEFDPFELRYQVADKWAAANLERAMKFGNQEMIDYYTQLRQKMAETYQSIGVPQITE